MPQDLLLRPGTAEDLPALAALHLRVRDAAYPLMPRRVHDDADVTAWVAGWDLLHSEVWVAEAARAPVGYARIHEDWLEDLYVDPDAAGQGVGSALLDLVRARRPGGFGLWVFVSNTRAIGFYRHHGLVEVTRTDGAGNEEREPDIHMAWPGATG
ncbi:GNAT family N-acetyltransferase [Nocardioides panaciterrulae]|uniref:GNAT superfamily N-acetyltransferase n=1 Tax=Nocardioides panaciterrulae TaxID=661492 RepID=A0A7Y9E5G2_9ACTN|nr:GNAT family N-acetyltransferase [Nocardioides panaciterrulae]NYD41490.1 GNAT superfamily N-acetyltransferase [Nocardioides panaciterrulae]